MKITAQSQGDFKDIIRKLKNMKNNFDGLDLDHYGKLGVSKLKEATPKDSNKTAESWGYEIQNTDKGKSLIFTNMNVTSEGTPIAILLQYGHATRSGTWYEGYDYINPTINKIIAELIEQINERRL